MARYHFFIFLRPASNAWCCHVTILPCFTPIFFTIHISKLLQIVPGILPTGMDLCNEYHHFTRYVFNASFLFQIHDMASRFHYAEYLALCKSRNVEVKACLPMHLMACHSQCCSTCLHEAETSWKRNERKRGGGGWRDWWGSWMEAKTSDDIEKLEINTNIEVEPSADDADALCEASSTNFEPGDVVGYMTSLCWNISIKKCIVIGFPIILSKTAYQAWVNKYLKCQTYRHQWQYPPAFTIPSTSWVVYLMWPDFFSLAV